MAAAAVDKLVNKRAAAAAKDQNANTNLQTDFPALTNRRG
jgi:hypothetical protein